MAQNAFECDRYWRAATRLVRHIYRLTATFPADEKAGLTGQIRRTSFALPVRLAEYATTTDPLAQATSLATAIETLREIRSYFLLAHRLGFINAPACWRMSMRISRVVRLYTRRRTRLNVPRDKPQTCKPTLTFRHLQRAA